MFKNFFDFFSPIFKAGYFKELFGGDMALYNYTTARDVQFVVFVSWKNPLFDIWFNGYDQKITILKITFERYDHNSNIPAW